MVCWFTHWIAAFLVSLLYWQNYFLYSHGFAATTGCQLNISAPFCIPFCHLSPTASGLCCYYAFPSGVLLGFYLIVWILTLSSCFWSWYKQIINVGGKEFKFTWSRERGDLCDIYEEHQSGEDGNGVLIEAGCAWRKLNVQRTLDESTTSHMKMRSVEAEQRTKSRKYKF